MPDDLRQAIGQFGVWRLNFRTTPATAADLERFGFQTLWIGGSPGADLHAIEAILDATTSLMVATGIVNIWQSDVQELARSYARIEARHEGRLVLGIGAGHREVIDHYRTPYTAISDYLDELTSSGVRADRIVLAALGPKMLRLSGERAAGAHSYLVPLEHTRGARDVLGPRPLLIPEHKVVLETDPARARAIARPPIRKPYLGLSNYTNNLRRLGWTEEDLVDGGSDALIDALVAHGTPARVAALLHEHVTAGADHVAIQLLSGGPDESTAPYRTLAEALQLTGA